MIIEIENDIIKLFGRVEKNLWPATRAAASMMLDSGVENIIIDCRGIELITEKGLETFANAFDYMNRRNIRIFFVGVDEKVEKLALSTPGIRSVMPIAESLEVAYKSIAIDKQMNKIYKEKYLLFPMLGNPSHAIMFGDLFIKRDREFNFVYPLLVPRKWTLYHPIKSLEDKANSDLGRAEGFSIFCNRKSLGLTVRARNYEGFFQRLCQKFPMSQILMSFAGRDMEREDNIEKFLCFIRLKGLTGVAVTEPYNKKSPFTIKDSFKKIIVCLTGEEKRDRTSEAFAKRFVKEGSMVYFVKPKKIKLNEEPNNNLEYVEGFDSGIEYKSYVTASVRHIGPFMRSYVEKEEGDMLVLPALADDEDFMLSMVKDPFCTTCFVNGNII